MWNRKRQNKITKSFPRTTKQSFENASLAWSILIKFTFWDRNLAGKRHRGLLENFTLISFTRRLNFCSPPSSNLFHSAIVRYFFASISWLFTDEKASTKMITGSWKRLYFDDYVRSGNLFTIALKICETFSAYDKSLITIDHWCMRRYEVSY